MKWLQNYKILKYHTNKMVWGRLERRGVAELDGLKQSFQCKVLQLHFEAEEERMVDSEEIFWLELGKWNCDEAIIWFGIAIAVERVIIKWWDGERTRDENGLGKDWEKGEDEDRFDWEFSLLWQW